MRKVVLFLSILLLSFSFPVSSLAAIISIKSDGSIVWNVLSEETAFPLETPRHSYIEVKKVAEEETSKDTQVFLRRINNKVSLVVSNKGKVRELDVSENQRDLVEIEERPEVQKLAIGMVGDKFSLQQEGVFALTSYPIQVDAKKAKILVSTPSGDRFILVFPREAVESALRTKIINRLTSNSLDIFEKDLQLQYKVEVEKVFNFFNIFEYSIPVTAFISATTGEMLKIDSPTIFKYLRFLFV